MKRDFNKSVNTTFDLIVIGGGIIGAGVARDAALRGLKTLLVDKEDFAYGTTSRSSRLIHGGLRYLSKMEFGLVRLDMRERETLLRIAPHLVKPLPFLIPIVSNFNRFVMSAGTLLYDIISFDKTLPSRKYLSRNETMQLEPELKLKNLKGAYQYYDCQVSFTERLCLENAISASENGAQVINHAKVTGVLQDNSRVSGVELEDCLTGHVYKVKTRMLVNTAGHWMDSIYGMAKSSPNRQIRRTKGVHLVTPRISNNSDNLFKAYFFSLIIICNLLTSASNCAISIFSCSTCSLIRSLLCIISAQ